MAKRSNAGNVNATKKSLEGKTTINSDVKINKLMFEEPNRTEFYCYACGKSFKKQDGNFCKSLSPLYANNNGFVHICKKCTDKYYYNLVDLFSGNEEKAMDRMCQIFDWYYSDEIFAATRKISADRSRVCAYPAKANLPQYEAKDKHHIDTIKDRYKAINESERLHEQALQEALAPNTITSIYSKKSATGGSSIKRDHAKEVSKDNKLEIDKGIINKDKEDQLDYSDFEKDEKAEEDV